MKHRETFSSMESIERAVLILFHTFFLLNKKKIQWRSITRAVIYCKFSFREWEEWL